MMAESNTKASLCEYSTNGRGLGWPWASSQWALAISRVKEGLRRHHHHCLNRRHRQTEEMEVHSRDDNVASATHGSGHSTVGLLRLIWTPSRGGGDAICTRISFARASYCKSMGSSTRSLYIRILIRILGQFVYLKWHGHTFLVIDFRIEWFSWHNPHLNVLILTVKLKPWPYSQYPKVHLATSVSCFFEREREREREREEGGVKPKTRVLSFKGWLSTLHE